MEEQINTTKETAAIMEEQDREGDGITTEDQRRQHIRQVMFFHIIIKTLRKLIVFSQRGPYVSATNGPTIHKIVGTVYGKGEPTMATVDGPGGPFIV